MYALTRPGALLRIEGAFALGIATYLFWRTDGNWTLYALLIVAPDIGILGYLRGSRLGSAMYNFFHTYAVPAALGVAGTLTDTALLVSVALVWAAHIGADRMLGYGLKYAFTRFMDTHLHRV
ncbi:MAG TPA: DUF4260 domain-containing protein [Candidatus Limnocylindria bacterium]|nr:DUF4260 domain-containing protein [Candidatus Limnocylindria bacterium]